LDGVSRQPCKDWAAVCLQTMALESLQGCQLPCGQARHHTQSHQKHYSPGHQVCEASWCMGVSRLIVAYCTATTHTVQRQHILYSDNTYCTATTHTVQRQHILHSDNTYLIGQACACEATRVICPCHGYSCNLRGNGNSAEAAVAQRRSTSNYSLARLHANTTDLCSCIA
jgi:hypothetical protein